MRVLIVDSGVIGVTTAYSLRRRGYEVIVIDREDAPGRGTSFANGGLLTPSMPEPWNVPGCWWALIASLAHRDSAMRLRLRALPGLLPWGLQFLRNSRKARFGRNTLANLRLVLYSMKILKARRR